ncbi:AIPR family protein [Desulfovibrio falkowii]|uniref:AIPR family protein n=1 Tax=Desulfovibrio sp. WGS1351 TaxID=3366814 RepID=UPI00372D10DF
MSSMPYEVAFKGHKNLISQLGEGNAFLVWAMGLVINRTDLHDLASECLTDSSNDKKIDFICLDVEDRKIVFAQGYYSSRRTAEAPANKASDINTAVAWLYSGDIEGVPEKLRLIIKACRDAIDEKSIDSIEAYYVHNLPESINVASELRTIENHHSNIFKENEISISAKELGSPEVNKLYTNKETDIVVLDEITLAVNSCFVESSEKWKSYVFSISGVELRDLYKKYSADLFSANYRSFLGSSSRRKINSTIRLTAETNEKDFWAFNNGITILTKKVIKKGSSLVLSGASIINGAQTTGSIGNAESKTGFSDLNILCRVVECLDADTISKIVQYNNTQNVIKAWDRYSNNETQIALEKVFKTLGHSYSIKRSISISDVDISMENVVQPLLAWIGDYKDANRGRNSIFERKELYDKAFDTTAYHILFVYSLSRCIDNIKTNLKGKIEKTEKEEKILSLLTHLKFKHFFIAIISTVMSELLERKVSQKHIAFMHDISKRESNSILELAAMWTQFLEICINYLAGSIKKDFSLVWDDKEEFDSVSNSLQAFVSTIKNTSLGSIDALRDAIDPNV